MRSEVGFVAFHLVLAVSGGALLHAVGLVSAEPRRLAAAAGPCLFAGIALVIPVQIALTVVGVPVTLATFVVVALATAVVVAAAGVAARRRWPAALGDVDGPREREPAEVWAVRIAAAVIALFFLFGARTFAKLPTVTDDANIWSTKALALFFYDHLQADVFTGKAFARSHLDYPILQPLLEADLYRAMGRHALQLAHLELWIVYGSFVWTVGFLMSRLSRSVIWLAPVAALAVAPGAQDWLKIGYADVTVAAFAAVGSLCIGLWLEGRRLAHLLLGAVFLGAAANTKNEGLAAVVAVLVAAAATLAAGRDWGALRSLAGGALASLALLLPWRLWVSGHDLENTDVTPLGDALSWGFLTDRLHRLGRAVEEIAAQLANQGRWVWIVPSALVLLVAMVVAGVRRPLAAYYLTTAALLLASVLWVYWTGRPEIEFHLATSAGRTVTGAVFVGAVALAHLGSLIPLPRWVRR